MQPFGCAFDGQPADGAAAHIGGPALVMDVELASLTVTAS